MLRASAVLAALALATPIALASSPTEERNLDLFLALLGYEEAPEGTATVHNAGAVELTTIAEALRLAAARAGDVDLGALVASANVGPLGGVRCIGDCWLFEIGAGTCPAATFVPTPIPFTAFHGQLWTYGGGIGTMTTSGPTLVIDWTTKVLGGVAPGGVTFIGQSDFFCIEFFGLYILFPFVNGVVLEN